MRPCHDTALLRLANEDGNYGGSVDGKGGIWNHTPPCAAVAKAGSPVEKSGSARMLALEYAELVGQRNHAARA